MPMVCSPTRQRFDRSSPRGSPASCGTGIGAVELGGCLASGGRLLRRQQGPGNHQQGGAELAEEHQQQQALKLGQAGEGDQDGGPAAAAEGRQLGAGPVRGGAPPGAWTWAWAIGCHQKGTSWSSLALAVVQAGVGFPVDWLGAGPLSGLATASAGGVL